MSNSLLPAISCPADLRALPADRLPGLAGEIREFLVEKVCRTGGHLGPNLGVVELSIALHRVFNSPVDRIVFDTGHQSYVHKLLTGRRSDFDQLRQRHGLSGYPSRTESVHDAIENSHASTALSYADGLARSLALRDEHDRKVVAVVGDGAMTGGMCWEALNNIAGADSPPVIVVLNDNTRSYAPTSGGLAAHLAGLRNGDSTGNLFGALGLAYLGPVDGHDIPAVEECLRQATSLGRSVVVHCVTRKGMGYSHAENDEADCLHAVGVVDPVSARPAGSSKPSWTSVFGTEIAEIARQHPEVVAVTASMLRPTGLLEFSRAFPSRVVDVGIAEQHAVTSAAGLAMAGMHPVVAVYSTFLTRAMDQVLMDVALHRLPVTFVLDRAGVTGPDGPSHHGMWDLSLLAAVPGLRLAVPRDPARLRQLLRTAIGIDSGPTALRFPKATAGADIPEVGQVSGMDVLRTGSDVLLIGLGPLLQACLDAADILAGQGVETTVVDPRWAAPLNPYLTELAATHQITVTVEDNVETGGFGARVTHLLATAGCPTRMLTLALPSSFLPHGPRNHLLTEAGLDAGSIAQSVVDVLTGDTNRRKVTNGRLRLVH